MNTSVIVLALVLLTGSLAALSGEPESFTTGIARYESVQAPSGRYVAICGVGLADVSPSFRMRLRVLLVEMGGVTVRQVLPWVRRPYVVEWSGDDVLLVCGAADDAETEKPAFRVLAMHVTGDTRSEFRKPTESERETVIKVFEAKHGFRPSLIKTSEK